ncbi:MAG: TonB C-terminal domain-containing protein [Candidatus Obscuribacterales bacterium]|jgi:hypothetical protein
MNSSAANSKKICRMAFALSGALSLSAALVLNLPAFAAAVSDPAQFIMDYYAAKAKTKFPLEVHGFFSKRIVVKQLEFEKERKEKPEEFAMMMKMAEAFGGQEPSKIKVVGKDATLSTPARQIFNIEAVEIPKSYKDMMKPDAKCSLKGQVALVKEDGEWKIDKDFWKFESEGKDGKFSQSSGLNPDRDDKKAGIESADSSSSDSSSPSFSGATPGDGDDSKWVPSDSDDLLDRIMKLWKRDKTVTSKDSKGKSIYAAIKVDKTGEIVDLQVGGESAQPEAESQLRQFFKTAQPFKPLPASHDGKMNAWMMFDWSNQGEAISGPYFSEGPVSDSIVNKINHKADN